MKDMGVPKCFLGINLKIDKRNGTIFLCQEEYTKTILSRFNMAECNPHNTPMVTRQVHNKSSVQIKNTKTNNNISERIPFREAIGSLMYLANGTRPDIAYSVNFLARKQHEPTQENWLEVKRIFRYLKGNTSLGLKYKSIKNGLEAFSDASFRDCDDSTSTAGYVINLFGDTISWRSHK